MCEEFREEKVRDVVGTDSQLSERVVKSLDEDIEDVVQLSVACVVTAENDGLDIPFIALYGIQTKRQGIRDNSAFRFGLWSRGPAEGVDALPGSTGSLMEALKRKIRSGLQAEEPAEPERTTNAGQ